MPPDETLDLDPYLSIDTSDLATAHTWLQTLYGLRALEVSASHFAWRARIANLGSVAIVQGVMRPAVPVRLEVATRAYVISLLTQSSARVMAQGERAEVALGRGAAVCSPGSAVDWSTAGGFRTNNVCMEPAFLAAQMEALTGEHVAKLPTFALQMRTGSGPGGHLERLLLLLGEEIERGMHLEHPVLVSNLCEAVARALLLGQPHDLAYLLKRPATLSSSSAVRMVEEYAEAHAGEPIRTTDLVALTGASVGSLEAAFRKHRGTTAAAFIQEKRLELARQQLLAEPAAPLTRVARAAGFLRLARFEAAYVAAFHETPVETRRRGMLALGTPSPLDAEERVAQAARVALLTRRQREVCAMASRGMLNKQISAELGISEGMVERHRARAMKKLGVGGAAELGRLWERLGG